MLKLCNKSLLDRTFLIEIGISPVRKENSGIFISEILSNHILAKIAKEQIVIPVQVFAEEYELLHVIPKAVDGYTEPLPFIPRY